MSIIGGILMAVGGIMAFIYGIIILIAAFKKSILWGLGSIFVPFVALVFIIKYWDECKKPFLMYLLGMVVVIVGSMMAGTGLSELEANTPAAIERSE